MRIFTFNIFLIINLKNAKNEREKHVRKQGKKTVRNASENDTNANVSATKPTVGRPESGAVIGIAPRHRREVIKDIIAWKEKRYLLEDKSTSIKALAKWAYDHFDFKSEDDKELAISTVEQLFGEIWREEHLDITVQKRKEREEHKKKNLHTN